MPDWLLFGPLPWLVAIAVLSALLIWRFELRARRDEAIARKRTEMAADQRSVCEAMQQALLRCEVRAQELERENGKGEQK